MAELLGKLTHRVLAWQVFVRGADWVDSDITLAYTGTMCFRTVLVAIALMIFGGQPALAYCPPNLDYTLKGEFVRVDFVVLVRVEKVTWLDDQRRPTKLKMPLALGNQPGGLDPYIGAYYSVRLIEAFKGNPPRTFRVFSENTSARTPLRMDKNLLLFLTRSRAANEYERVGDLTADSCGNSSLATTRKVAALRGLRTKR